MSKNIICDINLNGNMIKNVVADVLSSAPGSPIEGQFYYNDSLNKLGYYDGSEWIYVEAKIPTISTAEYESGANQGQLYTIITGDTYVTGDTNVTGDIKAKDPDSNNVISLVSPTFTEASTRTNVASGDSHITLWGKVKKYFSDLKTVAFSGSYTDLTDTPTLPTITFRQWATV